MMTLNGLPGARPRCSSHGLLLDDASTCARCVRESETHDGRRTLARLLVGAFAIVALLALYRVGAATYDAFATGSSRPAAAQVQAENGSRLVVYTSASCGVCRLAKRWMDEHAVTYEERHVDSDDAARRQLAGLGKGMVVPTFVVDGDQVLTGFDVQGVRLSQALASHGIKN